MNEYHRIGNPVRITCVSWGIHSWGGGICGPPYLNCSKINKMFSLKVSVSVTKYFRIFKFEVLF